MELLPSVVAVLVFSLPEADPSFHTRHPIGAPARSPSIFCTYLIMYVALWLQN